ncbi:MAG: hypothetical protein ACTHU0_21300 [Kofleriaceae bacterium]
MAALPEGPFNLDTADGGPRRPSIANVGGAALTEKPPNPPQDGTMLYADMCNGWQHLLRGLGAVTATLKLEVRFSAGTPAVHALLATKDGLEVDDFVVTDNGTGDTTITWPADAIPPTTITPGVRIRGATCAIGQAEYVTNGVRVYTFNAAGVATDADFAVVID